MTRPNGFETANRRRKASRLLGVLDVAAGGVIVGRELAKLYRAKRRQLRERKAAGGAYYIDVGNDAQSFFSHRLDRHSDLAAKNALRRFLRNNAWPTPVVGRLYRWDAEASAPASQPLLVVEVP